MEHRYFDEAFEKGQPLEYIVRTLQLDNGEAEWKIWHIDDHHVAKVCNLPRAILLLCYMYVHEAVEEILVIITNIILSYENVVRHYNEQEHKTGSYQKYHAFLSLVEFQVVLSSHELEQAEAYEGGVQN